MKLSKYVDRYESDATQFLNQLKQNNPEIEEQQRIGRAIWWDKDPIDLDERARQEASRIKQQPYVYQNKVR